MSDFVDLREFAEVLKVKQEDLVGVSGASYEGGD